MMSMGLSKEAILLKSFRKEKLSVPEWGGDVYIRHVSGKQREAVQSQAKKVKDGGPEMAFASELLAMCLCDESGAALFAPDEIPTLEGAMIERLALHCVKVNGLGKQDDIEKN